MGYILYFLAVSASTVKYATILVNFKGITKGNMKINILVDAYKKGWVSIQCFPCIRSHASDKWMKKRKNGGQLFATFFYSTLPTHIVNIISNDDVKIWGIERIMPRTWDQGTDCGTSYLRHTVQAFAMWWSARPPWIQCFPRIAVNQSKGCLYSYCSGSVDIRNASPCWCTTFHWTFMVEYVVQHLTLFSDLHSALRVMSNDPSSSRPGENSSVTSDKPVVSVRASWKRAVLLPLSPEINPQNRWKCSSTLSSYL